jgi:hypothetical protein
VSDNLETVLKFVHVACAAAWLGAALWVPGDVRRTLTRGRPAVDALAARAGPALGFDVIAGAAAILTGVLLMAVTRNHGTGIVVGFVAAIARFLLVLLALRPAWGKVQAAIAAGGDLAGAEAPARRMGMLSGIAHTLWLIALAGMFWQG